MSEKQGYFKRLPTEEDLRLSPEEIDELKRIDEATRRPLPRREIIPPEIHKGPPRKRGRR